MTECFPQIRVMDELLVKFLSLGVLVSGTNSKSISTLAASDADPTTKRSKRPPRTRLILHRR